jgi:hypothetical protein
MAITWISWGVALGCINLAPKGLFDTYLGYERFLKKSNLFLFEYIGVQKNKIMSQQPTAFDSCLKAQVP